MSGGGWVNDTELSKEEVKKLARYEFALEECFSALPDASGASKP